MFERRKIIAAFIGGLALCATIQADMVPQSPVDAGYQPSPRIDVSTNPQPANSFCSFVDFAESPDFGSMAARFLPQPAVQAGQTSETKPAQILADRQNSLSLCLYALFGLGLCRSAPFVKKLHLGCIPDWYHSGGPSQIGHSFAISPDCLTAAPVVCFIQPVGETEDVGAAYFSGVIAALLRKSQFTPTTLASRGPPSMS